MAKLHFRSYTTNQMVLFPQRIDENIAENDPVRIVSSIVDHLDMSSVNKLYNGMGRCPYHPRMMLKVIIYAYMNNMAHPIYLGGNFLILQKIYTFVP